MTMTRSVREELDAVQRAATRLADLRGIEGKPTEIVEFVRSKGRWYVQVVFDGKPQTLDGAKLVEIIESHDKS